MNIELATRHDACQIAEISRDLIEAGLGWSWQAERVLRAIQNPDAVVIKAVVEAKLIGFAIMRFGFDEAHLDLLAVKQNQRRQNIGYSLMEWLEKSALTAGIPIIRLEVRETNVGALQFYKKLGYTRVRSVKGYYRSKEAAIQMARDLWCDVLIKIT